MSVHYKLFILSFEIDKNKNTLSQLFAMSKWKYIQHITKFIYIYNYKIVCNFNSEVLPGWEEPKECSMKDWNN